MLCSHTNIRHTETHDPRSLRISHPDQQARRSGLARLLESRETGEEAVRLRRKLHPRILHHESRLGAGSDYHNEDTVLEPDPRQVMSTKLGDGCLRVKDIRPALGLAEQTRDIFICQMVQMSHTNHLHSNLTEPRTLDGIGNMYSSRV